MLAAIAITAGAVIATVAALRALALLQTAVWTIFVVAVGGTAIGFGYAALLFQHQADQQVARRWLPLSPEEAIRFKSELRSIPYPPGYLVRCANRDCFELADSIIVALHEIGWNAQFEKMETKEIIGTGILTTGTDQLIADALLQATKGRLKVTPLIARRVPGAWDRLVIGDRPL